MSKKTSQKKDMLDTVDENSDAEMNMEKLLYKELKAVMDDVKKDSKEIAEDVAKIRLSMVSMDGRIGTMEKLYQRNESKSENDEIKTALKTIADSLSGKKSDTKIGLPKYKNQLDWEKIGKGISWIIIATAAAIGGARAALSFFQS